MYATCGQSHIRWLAADGNGHPGLTGVLGKDWNVMIAAGAILLILGLLFGINLLFMLGIVLLVIGAVMSIRGARGYPVGGRRYWY